MELIRKVGASGMGADTPPSTPPTNLLALTASPEADKSEYGADDEGEDEYEIDCSLDYVPPSDESVLSEDFPSNESGKRLSTHCQTVIQDTTVVEKYQNSHNEAGLSEDSQQVNELERVRSSMLATGATEDLHNDIETHNSVEEVSSQHERNSVDEEMEKSNEDSLKQPEVGICTGEGDKSESSMEISPTEEKEQQTEDVQDSMVEELAGNESQVDGNAVELTEKIGELTQSDCQIQTSPTDQEAKAAEMKLVTIPQFLLLTNSPDSPATTKKRKQNITLKREAEEEIGLDNTATPQKKTPVAPTYTPKETKRAASKKQKKSAPTPEKSASGDEKSPPLRRSRRIKHEPPKFTFPAKRLGDETELSHFDRIAEKDVMMCKYCGKEVTTSRSWAKKHLKNCTGNQHLSDDDQEEKAAITSVSADNSDTNVKMEAPALESPSASLIHLMGSKDLADKVKGAFQTSVFTGHGPITRFQGLIRDDVTGLRHLQVQNLLDAVDPLDGQIVLLHVKSPGSRRCTGQENINPVSKAKARDMEHFSLRFPAPHNVAKNFIVPLATELGLEYMMHQHTAKIVSCPLQDSVLDWRCHRSEMVVFQLAGKALWKTRMGPVNNPVRCYHPDSWLLDDAAEVDKVHRVSSMRKHSLGTLTPPFDEFHVFNENESSEEEDEQLHEHILKPGSVVYLPAGTWFETETKGKNTMWLEVQLEAMTYENLLLAAVKQLSWRDSGMRKKMQLFSSRGEAKSVRHHMANCMKTIVEDLAALDSSDLVPEYLVTDDLKDLRAQGLINDVKNSSAFTSFQVDLMNPKFKLKHVKVLKDVVYRVNPVAILRSVEEISYLKEEEAPDTASITTHRALKKSPKPKPKRKQMLRVISHTGKYTYILDEVFGNDGFKSQLHVKFHCSAEQSRLIEWIRSRDADLFSVEDLNTICDNLWGKSSVRLKETGRNLLRFLCFVGYVTQVKSFKQQTTNEAS